MSPKILVADDEPDVLNLVSSNLIRSGFEVIAVEDGEAALEKSRLLMPDLLILDLMLPYLSGLEVCRSLKADAATAGIPIIMLTAKAEEIDRVVGLELGADDYVTKPFSPRELVLRVKGMLRRVTQHREEEVPEVLASGAIVVDRARMEVRVGGDPVDVTATELKLLAILIERRGRVQSRDTLLNDVWGYESAIDTRTVDTHIKRLREKLGAEAAQIETVRGFGYRVAG